MQASRKIDRKIRRVRTRIQITQSNYFCIDGARQDGTTLSSFLIQNIYNFNNKKDDLSECNKLYAKLENRSYTDSQKTKTLLVWVSDTSKLEEAYSCFFSQTKQFTDYLDGLKGE